jgi:Erv1 / Alr family
MSIAPVAATLDPSYWGPIFWEVMYIASASFSLEPTPNEKIGFKMFFDSLRYVLPCSKCRADYDRYLETTPLRESDTRSRDTLFLWVNNLHRSISQKLNKNNIPTLEAARKNFFPPPAILAGLTNMLEQKSRYVQPSQAISQITLPVILPLKPQGRLQRIQHYGGASKSNTIDFIKTPPSAIGPLTRFVKTAPAKLPASKFVRPNHRGGSAGVVVPLTVSKKALVEEDMQKKSYLQQLSQQKSKMLVSPISEASKFERAKYVVGGCGCGGRKIVPFARGKK